MTGTSDAPPLGNRPAEPLPGKDSLEHPRGADGKSADEETPAKPECPDCGLPFGEHPEFHSHAGSGAPEAPGAPGGRVDLGDADMDADPLPGKALDAELGGDPAG